MPRGFYGALFLRYLLALLVFIFCHLDYLRKPGFNVSKLQSFKS
jgi:hypothetical protein